MKLVNTLKVGLLVSVAVLSGCSTVSNLTAKVTDKFRVMFGSSVAFAVPPENQALRGYRQLSVQSQPVHASTDLLAAEVRDRIVGVKIGGEPYFSDRASGRSARAIVTLKNFYNEPKSFVENRVKCPGKKMVNTCSNDEAYHYRVSCRSLTVGASGSIEIRDDLSGRVLAQKNLTESSHDKTCEDESNTELASLGELEARAMNNLAKALIGDLIPSFVEKPFDLQSDDESLSANDQSILKTAGDAASKGEITAALKMYRDLYARNPKSGVLAFNVGFLEHSLGNFRDAADHYKRASQSVNAPVSKIGKYDVDATNWVNRGIYSLTKS